MRSRTEDCVLRTGQNTKTIVSTPVAGAHATRDPGGPVLHSVLSPRSSVLLVALLATIALSGCGSKAPKSGGYYLDDGPHARPPSNLDRVADAVPRNEPIRPSNSRPYTVLGKTYTPFTGHRPYRARGLASWYGKRYHGQKTSTGETYDMYKMTAAHTLLPLPSYARVTNLANGRSVVVRVNDRGPFSEDRIIDLSYVAAHQLGFIDQGTARVEVEAILPGDSGRPPAPIVAATQPPPTPEPVASGAGGIYVQLGAFASPDNAEQFLNKIRFDLSWLASSMHLYQEGGLHKVHVGPYLSHDAAERDAERVRQSLGYGPFVLTR
ncbi:MAG: septal ring lytic transglycosylase RlpA family protein [Burkholderiales bacterium]